MTIGQLMECVLGKACAIEGRYGDSTPFTMSSTNNAGERICEQLAAAGMKEQQAYDRTGWETMYNGFTGEPVKAKVFCGPTFYQRLKHMISDKIHCLTGDHEVLTLRQGWKNIKDITVEDKVATLKDNKLVYDNPVKIMHYLDHEGEMYHIKNQAIDLSVTSNHRMWVSRKNRTWLPYDFKKAKDIFGKQVRYKKDALWIKDDYQFVLQQTTKFLTPTVNVDIGETKVSMSDWLIFFGIWYAEGWATGTKTSGSVQLAVNKQKVKDALYPALDNLNYKYSVKNEKLSIYDVQLYEYMKPLSVGAPQKELPQWVFKLSVEQVKILIRGMLLGDGSRSRNGCEFYYTSSVILADQFQQLCLHAGWAGNITVHNKKGHEVKIYGRKAVSNFDILRISVITKRLYPTVNHSHVKKQKIQEEKLIEEKCPVYCLHVPSEVFYVRKNGKAVWTGNSRSSGHVTSLCRQPFNFRTVKGSLKRVYYLVLFTLL